MKGGEIEMNRLLKYVWKYGILILVFVIVVFNFPLVTIPAGHRGVVTRWGAVQDKVLSEGGPYFRIPIMEKIIKMSVRTTKYQTDADSASKDLQSIMSTIALNYRLDPRKVNYLYQTIGTNREIEEMIIDPAIEESVKASTAKFTAEELITNRKQTRDSMTELLVAKLGDMSNSGIMVEEVNIVNFKFSEEFDNAIEAKVTAEQRALEEKWNLERVKFEAQQNIEKAKAEAESLRLQKQEVTEDLIKLRQIEVEKAKVEAQIKAIQKWDGKMPTYTGGVIPFLQIQ